MDDKHVSVVRVALPFDPYDDLCQEVWGDEPELQEDEIQTKAEQRVWSLERIQRLWATHRQQEWLMSNLTEEERKIVLPPSPLPPLPEIKGVPPLPSVDGSSCLACLHRKVGRRARRRAKRQAERVAIRWVTLPPPKEEPEGVVPVSLEGFRQLMRAVEALGIR